MSALPTSLQGFFDIAWKRANEMDKPAMDGTNCCYRSPNGPCLIGAAIPDELYSGAMETLSASAVLKSLGVAMDDDFIEVINELQRCHDASYTDIPLKPRLLKNLREFANEHGCIIPQFADAPVNSEVGR